MIPWKIQRLYSESASSSQIQQNQSAFLRAEERKEDPENTRVENGRTRGCTSSGVAPPQPEKEVEKC